MQIPGSPQPQTVVYCSVEHCSVMWSPTHCSSVMPTAAWNGAIVDVAVATVLVQAGPSKLPYTSAH